MTSPVSMINTGAVSERMISAATDFLALNGRHRDQTVFVIGAGPQLHHLEPSLLRALETRVTIGLNRTTYKLGLTYFLSAYISEVLIAQMRAGTDTTFLHMRPLYKTPLGAGIIALKRRRYEFGTNLPDTFSQPEP